MNNLNMASAHVVGHSYGGATAMRSVQLSPKRVRSLILIEPIYMPLLRDAAEGELFETYRGFAQSFINKANAGQSETAWRTFLDTRNGSGFWDRMGDAAGTRFLRNTERSVAGLQSSLSYSTTAPDCNRIAVSTTAVYGENPDALERRVTEIIAEAVPGCALQIVHSAGHMSPLSHPDVVATIINNYISAI